MARRPKAVVSPIPSEMAQPLDSGAAVDMQSPSGEPIQVEAGQAAALAALGYRQVTSELLGQQAEEKKYGDGIVNELEAGGLGILRGTTLGLSDLALRAYRPDWADAAAKLKQYNPDASLAGEVASFALPLAGSIKALGAAGKAASSAGILQSLVSGGGEALGKVAGKIVGENFAGVVAKSAVKTSAESAVYQAAHNLSENALADKELTAESILANTGHAAILGVGLGAAIPVAARTAQAVAESAPVRYAVSGAAKQFAKFFDPQRNLQLFSGAMKRELNPETGQKFQNAVNELHNDSGASFYSSGDVALDQATGKLVRTGPGAMPTQEAAIDRLETIKAQAGNTMGDTLKKADEVMAATDFVPSTEAKFWTKDAKKIGDKLEKWRTTAQITEPEALRLQETVNDIGRKINEKTSLSELHQMRMGLDARVGGKNWDKLAGEEVEIVKDMRRAVSQKIDQTLTEMSNHGLIPENTLGVWQNVNKLYRNLKTVEKPLTDAYARANSNVNVLGLRFSDIGIGAVGGGVLGGPAGIGLAVANKALQTDRGLLFRAQIGEKLQQLAWAEQLTNKSQGEISKSLERFFAGTDAAKASAVAIGKVGGPIEYAMATDAPPGQRIDNQQKWFADTRKQLLSVASSPEQFFQHQGDAIQPFADHAPNTANAVLAKQLQVYSYLTSVMPKNPAMPLSVVNDNWKPADYEVQNFRKVVQVARAPMTILDEMRRGTVTTQQAQAVRQLYPKLYESIVTQAQTAINEPGAKLTYPQQLRLNQLFPGIVPTARPEFVAAMQQPATKPDEKQTVRPPQGPVGFSDRRRAASDRSDAR